MPDKLADFSQTDARRLLTAAGERGVVAALREVLRKYRTDNWLTIEETAELADTSSRSLQRLLAADGTTYVELAEQVRSDLAQEMLKDTSVSVTEIGKQLGYSTVGNFARAFKRWTGKTPAEFRRNESDKTVGQAPPDEDTKSGRA